MKKIKLKGGYKGYLIGKTEKFEFGISTCGKLFVEIVDKSERPEFDNTSDYPNIWKYEIIEHLKTISPITCEIIYSTDTVGLDREECGMQDIEVTTENGIVKVSINNTRGKTEVYGFNLGSYKNGEVGLIRITNKTLTKIIDIEKDIILEHILPYMKQTFSLSTGGVNENIAQAERIEGFYSKDGYCNIQVPPNVKIEIEFYFKHIAKDYYKELLESVVKSNNALLQTLKSIP